MSGTLNHLRKVWGPTPDTLAKIQVSCKTQESLEEANVFSPRVRHLLLVIKRLWKIDKVHDLPEVAVPSFFPSDSKGDECWWGTQDLNTVFLWDTMDNEDRQGSPDGTFCILEHKLGGCLTIKGRGLGSQVVSSVTSVLRSETSMCSSWVPHSLSNSRSLLSAIEGVWSCVSRSCCLWRMKTEITGFPRWVVVEISFGLGRCRALLR
jgi:hypothetical protein